MYARGSKRLDFILMDSTVLSSIKEVGTLGLHKGIHSDHVINRPVLNPASEL